MPSMENRLGMDRAPWTQDTKVGAEKGVLSANHNSFRFAKSSNSDASRNVKSSQHQKSVRTFRYKKHDDVEETSARRIASALKRFLLGRSMSDPESNSKQSGVGGCGKGMGSQLSLFQSAFDDNTADDEGPYRYDVNISYHKSQSKWVENLLIPILETELDLKCYIHERDSLPGVSTVKNIAAAVQESRVTILCFSKDYLVSSWQSYEALLAHHMDPVGWKKRILPIMVETCSLPFKYTIYATLKWPECTETTVPASVKLRRRFFVSGLLNALGVHSKQRALEVYKTYCDTNPHNERAAQSSQLSYNDNAKLR